MKSFLLQLVLFGLLTSCGRNHKSDGTSDPSPKNPPTTGITDSEPLAKDAKHLTVVFKNALSGTTRPLTVSAVKTVETSWIFQDGKLVQSKDIKSDKPTCALFVYSSENITHYSISKGETIELDRREPQKDKVTDSFSAYNVKTLMPAGYTMQFQCQDYADNKLTQSDILATMSTQAEVTFSK